MKYKCIMAKEEYIALRTSPKVKQILQKLAKSEYRSLSQQCEMIIIKWLQDHGHMKEQDDDS